MNNKSHNNSLKFNASSASIASNASKSYNASKSSNIATSATTVVQKYASSTVIYIIGFLVICLAIIYLYNFYKSFKLASASTNPNALPDCPDYWDSIGNGVCRNVNFLGSCAETPGSNTVDFSGDLFTNANIGNYAKCKWSQACNTSWSGVDRIC